MNFKASTPEIEPSKGPEPPKDPVPLPWRSYSRFSGRIVIFFERFPIKILHLSIILVDIDRIDA